VDESAVERTLVTCEQALAGSGTPDLRALGFWRALAVVKRDRNMVDRYASRIAVIDREAFRRRVTFALPIDLGIALVIGGLVVDLLLLALALTASHPWREVLLLVGAFGLNVAAHYLGHLVVGTLVGIAFTDFFIDLPPRRLPGFKIDYASYLRAAARARAWMHAAGAIATKVVPFLAVPYGLAIEAHPWSIIALLVLGIVQIVTDVLYSVRASDWKRFRREMRLAR